MPNLFKSIVLCLVIFSTAIVSAQYECNIPAEVKEHTIGKITVEHQDYDFIKISIRKTRDGYLAIEKLDVLRLFDITVDGKISRQYGFTGKQGDYLVEIEMFSTTKGFSEEQYFLKIIGDLPPPPGPIPPGPGPVPPVPPGPDPDPVPPNPSPIQPDIYNNIGIRINEIAPSAMRAEYSSEWFGLADAIADRSILRTTDAQRKAVDIISRYNSQGWTDVNNLIKKDSITRNMNITELEDYFRAIGIGCLGAK